MGMIKAENNECLVLLIFPNEFWNVFMHDVRRTECKWIHFKTSWENEQYQTRIVFCFSCTAKQQYMSTAVKKFTDFGKYRGLFLRRHGRRRLESSPLPGICAQVNIEYCQTATKRLTNDGKYQEIHHFNSKTIPFDPCIKFATKIHHLAASGDDNLFVLTSQSRRLSSARRHIVRASPWWCAWQKIGRIV